MDLMSSLATDRPTGEQPADDRHGRDWGFARRPFWMFSHLFALTVVSTFVFFGLWQLDRLGDRQQANELVEARVDEVMQLDGAPVGSATELDYRAVTAQVTFVDPDFVRVVNRSQGGVAGEYVVAIVELADGTPLAVNRGFVPANADVVLDPVPDGLTTVDGWLRATVERGWFGADDGGEGTRLPRLDTERVGFRLGRELPSVWLQQAPVDDSARLATFPDPVPLPPIDDGPHLSYAVQWFTFATLGVLFYLALLWRRSRGDERVDVEPLADPVGEAKLDGS
jgi:surfeit locus 1 family protein